ncbi:MAG: LysR family transcriptional regulator [Oscillospiraceae bacterium]|jgi:DNA-binding transcriptional LysR family regulator|nr:LysR family transcriptional regulator [Oscillospiraceae bacterium]
MTEKQIQYFFAVYKSGSISRAAVELFVSRSVISRAIKELEESAGFSLLTRRPDGIALTPQGKVVYTMLNEFARTFDLTMSNLRNALPSDEAKTLRIGIAYNCGEWFYPFVQKPFCEKYPDVNITIEGVRCEDIPKLIIDNVYDFVIGPQTEESAGHLGAMELYTDQWVLCAPKDGELSGLHEVAIEYCVNLSVAVLDTLPREDYECREVVLTTRSPEMVHMAVANGFAHAVFPIEICGGWNDIKIIPFFPRVNTPMCLLWNRITRHNAVFDDFLRVVEGIDFGQLRNSHGLYIPGGRDA